MGIISTFKQQMKPSLRRRRCVVLFSIFSTVQSTRLPASTSSILQQAPRAIFECGSNRKRQRDRELQPQPWTMSRSAVHTASLSDSVPPPPACASIDLRSRLGRRSFVYRSVCHLLVCDGLGWSILKKHGLLSRLVTALSTRGQSSPSHWS